MATISKETLNALQTELDFYRQNQSQVEAEIKTLIADNQKLSTQVGSLLKQKLMNARCLDEGHSKEMEQLKTQVALITKERDSLHVLWQNSQKTINALDAELNAYQNYNRGGPQTINEGKKDLELKLETSLTDYIELETNYKELNRKNVSLENQLNSKEKEILLYSERGKQLENKLEEMAKDLEECRINLAAEKKNNEDIKAQLMVCQKDAVNRVQREAEAKSKVAEALQLFDVVSSQKAEAYKKIAEMTEELTEVKLKLANLKREIESKVNKELDEIKDKYNEKVADMLGHIRNLDTELIEKGAILHKAFREIKILKEANDNYEKNNKDSLKDVDPKLAMAEQRLEAMFQELVISERRNIQLVCEKQCLALDIQRIQDSQSRERKRRDWEEGLLKTQCEELKLQVDHLQKSLNETHQMVNKLQEMLSSRTELNQKKVSRKEEELLETNKQLEKQMKLSKKWKETYIEMTEKLKKRLEEMQKENQDLRAKLKRSCETNDYDSLTSFTGS